MVFEKFTGNFHFWGWRRCFFSWGNLLRKGSPKPLPNLFGLLSNIECADFLFIGGFSWVCALTYR